LERIQWRYVAPLFVFLVLLPRKDLASGLETFEQALTRHHIELAKPALIEALRNPDGEVRGPAAWQLLEMKAEDSLPQILHAVRDERDGATKVNLASAAAYLGAKEGTTALEGSAMIPASMTGSEPTLRGTSSIFTTVRVCPISGN
jgi:hypothetical protein